MAEEKKIGAIKEELQAAEDVYKRQDMCRM